ncbi:hypothetical protein [Chryseobacterium sp.]|uniref:hypothetical protein n=1 Tax=Chryseobacterium sp. TaxID=1871047 RepID=UPI0028979806|nr:hypothetical protein [Chryseobacterium sp.]
MKFNLLLIALLMYCFVQCGKPKESTSTILQKIEYTDINKNSYFIDYSLRGNFEIYFNGILIEKKNTTENVMNYQYLNQFIEGSGEQEITIKVIPEQNTKDLSTELLKTISISIYFSENGDNPPLKQIAKLELPIYNKPQNSVLHSWKVKMDVPYKTTQLKDEALNISTGNTDQLFKEVKDYYLRMHNIINSGNSKEYIDLYRKSIARETETSYYSETQNEKYILNLAERVEKSKDCMLPMLNSHLVIHPNGLLVEMQDEHYDSPLISKDKNGKTRTFGLVLYRSKKTGKLEVY